MTSYELLFSAIHSAFFNFINKEVTTPRSQKQGGQYSSDYTI